MEIHKAPLTDTSLMPFGKYKSVAMANVPDDYLYGLYRNTPHLQQDVKDYIEDNLDSIRKNMNNDESDL